MKLRNLTLCAAALFLPLSAAACGTEGKKDADDKTETTVKDDTTTTVEDETTTTVEETTTTAEEETTTTTESSTTEGGDSGDNGDSIGDYSEEEIIAELTKAGIPEATARCAAGKLKAIDITEAELEDPSSPKMEEFTKIMTECMGAS